MEAGVRALESLERFDEEELSESFSIVELSRSESAFDVSKFREDSLSFADSLFDELIAGNPTPRDNSPSSVDTVFYEPPVIHLSYMNKEPSLYPTHAEPLLTPKEGCQRSSISVEDEQPGCFEDEEVLERTSVPKPQAHREEPRHATPRHAQFVAPYNIGPPTLAKLTQSTWGRILNFCEPKEIGAFCRVSSTARMFAKTQSRWKESYKLYCFLNVLPAKRSRRKFQLKRKKKPRIKADVWSQICVMGDSRCGKSSLVDRFGQNKYRPLQVRLANRISAQHRVVNIDGLTMRLSLWDTPPYSKERAKRFRSVFRNSRFHGVIICFDVTRPQAHIHAAQFMQKVNSLLMPTQQEIMIVGLKADKLKCNKSDLAQKEQVLLNQCIQLNVSPKIHYVSSKNGKGVFELVENVAEKLVERKLFTSPLKSDKNCCIM